MTVLRFRLTSFALMGLLVAGLLAVPAGGQDDPKPAKGKVIESKGQAGKLAAKVDFEVFGLSLAGLNTIGSRIDQARTAADPLALSLLAKELAVAETLSKKQAGIKSEALLEEAVKLAKLRENLDELKAVALLVSDKEMRDDLREQAAKVAQAIKDRQSGVRTRGIGGSLHVDSRVLLYIDVYVNNVHRGTLAPFGDIYNIFVGDNLLDTILYARAPGTGRTWGPIRVSGPIGNYTWRLTP